MKKYFLLIFTVLSLISPVSQAQTTNECVLTFTHDYFNWYRNETTIGSDTFEEWVKEEIAIAKGLLILLKNTNKEGCPEHNLNQINHMYRTTVSRLKNLNQLTNNINSGKVVNMPPEFVEATMNYHGYHSELIKSLMYETGVPW